MKLTPEQLRQTADAIEAAQAGRLVQYQATDGTWRDAETNPLEWTFNYDLGYRPKPEPVTRPWSKPEDVPGPVCWVVEQSMTASQCLVTSVSDVGISYVVSDIVRYVRWDESEKWKRLLHSTDRKEWKPCVTEEP